MILSSLFFLIATQTLDIECGKRLEALAVSADSIVDTEVERLLIEAYSLVVKALSQKELESLQNSPLDLPVATQLLSFSGSHPILKALSRIAKKQETNDFILELRSIIQEEISSRMEHSQKHHKIISKSEESIQNFKINLNVIKPAVRLSPDGNILYVFGRSGFPGMRSATLVNAKTGQIIRYRSGRKIQIGDASDHIFGFSLSKDGQFIYAASEKDGSIQQWNALAGMKLSNPRRRIHISEYPVQGLSLSKDRKRLLRSLEGNCVVQGLVISADDKYIFTLTPSGVYAWYSSTEKSKRTDRMPILQSDPENFYESIAIHPYKNILFAFASGADRVKIYKTDEINSSTRGDIQSFREIKIPEYIKSKNISIKTPHSTFPMLISRSGKILFTSTYGIIIPWDANTFEPIKNSEGKIIEISLLPYEDIHSLAISPDDATLYGASNTGEVASWQLADYLPLEYQAP